MADIIQKPVNKLEQLIFKHPMPGNDIDFKAEYKCSCGREMTWYSVGRPDIIKKCMKCLFGEGARVGIELV